MPDAERITEPIAYHGEGPFWDGVNERLLCVDVLAGEVMAITSACSVTRHKVSQVATVVRRRASGGLVIATEHGLVGTDDELSSFAQLAQITDDPRIRTNDGACDPLGAFVIGSMAYDESRGAGAVYRIGSDCRVTTILPSVTISNGIQWSADGRRVYYIDTPTRKIDVFDFDLETGAWTNRRVHIRLDAIEGFPDGMAIDEEDGLWVALWGDGAVHHYDAAGRLVDTIRTRGATQASSCAFGGSERKTLFITTSRQGLQSPEAEAGAIYAADTAFRGAVPWKFAG